MISRVLGTLILLLLTTLSFGQSVADRYPFVQSPTENSVIIAWRTHHPGTSMLVYGESAGAMTDTLRVSGENKKHKFELLGLEADHQYYYQALTPGVFTSNVEHFRTAKPSQKSGIRFLHYGDCGYDNQIQNDLAKLMEKEEVDFGIVAGDVDQGNGDAYDKIFFGVYKNMLAHDCHYPALGNHDCIKDNGETYLDAFYLPHNNPQQTERYYSFVWGNAKFICLDSNSDYSPGSDQHNWLLEELENREREWLFVFFHHPPWTNMWDPGYYLPMQKYYKYEGNEDMRSYLVPYFERFKVDFVLNGHAHSYQRGEYNGVHYVISGGAGVKMLDKHTNDHAPNIQMELSENHYVRFEINEDKVSWEAVNIEGEIIDHVEVEKPRIFVEKPVLPSPEPDKAGTEAGAGGH